MILVVDRLLPGWPLLVFREPPMSALELLERAVAREPLTPAASDDDTSAVVPIHLCLERIR